MQPESRSYYCSQKFRFLKIDLIANTIYTCDAAKPQRVDLEWLEHNPGQLFNTPVTVNDRKLMLQNIRNENCEQNCWPAEDKGSISPRLFRKGDIKTHADIYQQPETIDLTVNGECNLTCSYCCKEFSSAWRRDIIANGDYVLSNPTDRYKKTIKDVTLENLGQADLKNSKNYQLMLNEVRLAAPTLKRLFITGGEPLLDNQLIDILSDIPFDPDIEFNLFTGLGLSKSRFDKLLNKLTVLSQKYKNFRIKISAESTEKFYEFNRYGNTWEDFQNKIELLQTHDIKFVFHSTISNLTLFSFADFYNMFSSVEFTCDFVHQPTMLSPHIIDNETKNMLKLILAGLDYKHKDTILAAIEPTPTDIEKTNLKEFLLEFTQRRPDLTLNIFPKSFLEWLDIHVV